MALHLRYAARSDVGLVREGNEDSGYAGPSLLLVADGMGGHAAGELASAIAIATVADLDMNPPQQDDVLASLRDAIGYVGDEIAGVIEAEPDLTGMGTTVTGLYWLGDRVSVVHVGDSRAYLLRAGSLTQITHDHTYVQTLVDAGRISEEEALVHPRRSLLTHALDGMNPVEADLAVHGAHAGDRFLLCTDGLSGVLSNAEIAMLLGDGEPTGCVTRLVDLALERGAPDNVTVVVADVVDGLEPDAVWPVVVGAAGEPRVRHRLPGVQFPNDAQPDPDRPDAPPPSSEGPPTAPQAFIDSALIVPAAESARHQARKRTMDDVARRTRRRRIATALGVLVVVGVAVLVGVMVARTWITGQWYVAVNGSAGTGTVAIYQGVPGSLLGVPLSSLTSDSGLEVGTLPLFDQELVSKSIPATSQTDAERIVTELQGRSAQCQTAVPPAGCPGAPS